MTAAANDAVSAQHPAGRSASPIGYFVHHQGRGHAERAAAIAAELVPNRPVTLFCARDDIFPPLADGIEVVGIPSLFEPDGPIPPALADQPTPDTLHCAPLGWSSITQAISTITGWFARHQPALFITDVSAELGQLARIASVPHMAVLQHGDRSDPGHMSSYRSAVGLLAPYARTLEQPERAPWMAEKTIYAPGVGIDCNRLTPRDEARRKLGLPEHADLVVVLGGGGGHGLPSAPLTLGARDDSKAEWVTLGRIETEWHETPPGNLRHLGWVDNPEDWISAADRIVSSCGNTTVHMVAAAGKPWIAIPEWRYFNEQTCKAEALDRAGVAATARQWPSSAQDWRKLWHAALAVDRGAQQSLVNDGAARDAAREIEAVIHRIWSDEPVHPALPSNTEAAAVS